MTQGAWKIEIVRKEAVITTIHIHCTFISTHSHTDISMQTITCTHAHTPKCTHTDAWELCTCTYIHTHTHTHTYTYSHIHIHTHTQTHV